MLSAISRRASRPSTRRVRLARVSDALLIEHERTPRVRLLYFAAGGQIHPRRFDDESEEPLATNVVNMPSCSPPDLKPDEGKEKPAGN